MPCTEQEAVLAYIDSYSSLAKDEMHRSGIPASIKLGQAIVESNAGRSILAKRANNHFGIKCKSYWTGQKYFYADDDRDVNGNRIESCFRFYASSVESFKDHSSFLTQSERYAPLFELQKTDYKGWAYGLKECGYATDVTYARKLTSVIERYELHRFDAYE